MEICDAEKVSVDDFGQDGSEQEVG